MTALPEGVDPAGAEAVYPLSPMQEAMLFHTRYAPGAGASIGQMTCLLQGELDAGAFGRAWQDLVDRHPALRTSFHFEGLERPVQVVHRRASLPFTVDDLRGLSPEVREARVERYLDEDRRRPFDLGRAPLLRVRLLHLDGATTRLVWTRHHAVLDGWSVNLLTEELLDRYRAHREGSAEPMPPGPAFRGFIDWLEARGRGADDAFWRRELAGLGEVAGLTGDPPVRGAVPEASLVEVKRSLGAEAGARLRAFARELGVTPATVLAGAWALVAARYAGRDEAVFGLTVSGRPEELPGVESVVGLFLETVPLRVRLPAAGVGAGEWLRGLQAHLATVREHAHVPLAELRRHAGVPADRELFDHILVLESYPLPMAEEGPLELGGLVLDDYRFIDQTTFPLNVGVVAGQGFTLLAVHDPERIAAPFVDRLVESYRRALAELCEGRRPVAELGALAPAELDLLAAANATATRWPEPERGLLERIAARVAESPDAVAVDAHDGCWSYAALWRAAGALARRLADAGAGPEAPVALVLERSAALPAEVLGTLLALAPPGTPGLEAVEVLPVDRPGEARASEPAPPLPPHRDDAAAYVLFTSGSTGRPKAVVNTHGGLLNRLLWMQVAYPVGPGDAVLQKTPTVFDVSVWELLWPFLAGATQVLAAPGEHRDPVTLRDAIVARRVTVAHFVPSMLRAFLEAGPEACTSLSHLVTSGEALTPDLVAAVHRSLPRLATAGLHNLYGPTEAAIDVTHHECRDPEVDEVPLGRPIANLRVALLDRRLRAAPRGTAGEIALGGAGLARGYLGRPALTAGRFVPDPLAALWPAPGSRLYRTGDLGRVDEAGRVRFLGRTDFQLKLRGMRIEPGEIEAALRDCPGVREAVVTPVVADGDVRLVAHAEGPGLAADGAAALAAECRRRLRDRLPEAMVPARVRLLAELPRLPSGKLDRGALARSTRGEGGATAPSAGRRIDPPSTPVEEELAAIWREVLGLDAVGVRESFFELGGHSLLLASVAARIERAFAVRVPLRRLFNAPTIVAMTEAIAECQAAEEDPEELARMVAELQGIDPSEVDALLRAGDGEEAAG